MVLRILGVVLAVWIVLSLLGAVFEFLTWALVIGAVVALGVGVFTAVRSHNRRSLGR
jgi:hypothetical protein